MIDKYHPKVGYLDSYMPPPGLKAGPYPPRLMLIKQNWTLLILNPIKPLLNTTAVV